ncbi:MAG: ethanolamine utilization protein EutH [Clostridia bacterium]|nr:ethanolamine utilization protein EutH [Clostridia bacterium]
MTAETVIIGIMVIFAVAGGIDKIFGSKLGLGKEFEKGILTIGQLIMTMAGIIFLSRAAAALLLPVVAPVYEFIGSDPAIFAGSLLACDMGGLPLAKELAASEDAARLGGIIVSSMLGVTVSFTIPTAMAMTKKEDSSEVAKGILCGILTVPVGILVGGLFAKMNILFVLVNILPTLPLALIIAIGIWKFEKVIIKVFFVFGKIIGAIAVIGLMLSIMSILLDVNPIKDVIPVDETLVTIGKISLVLAGAFPLMFVVNKLLSRPLVFLGKKLGLDGESMLGLIAGLVNSLVVFSAIEKMDKRGKVVNMAFAVSASFALGDHLAYTAAECPEMILPMIAGKLFAGASAVLVAMLITKPKKQSKSSIT